MQLSLQLPVKTAICQKNIPSQNPLEGLNIVFKTVVYF